MITDSIVSVFSPQYLAALTSHFYLLPVLALPVIFPHLQCHCSSPAELWGCGLLPARAQIPAGVLEKPTEWWGARGYQPVAETTYYFLSTWHEPVLPPPVCEGEVLLWTKSCFSLSSRALASSCWVELKELQREPAFLDEVYSQRDLISNHFFHTLAGILIPDTL